MILLLVFLVLTIAVTVSLTWPLLRHGKASTVQGKQDIAVYREQLVEIDSDITRGLLAKAQAETVRIEIYRRMLAAENVTRHKVVTSRTRKFFAALIIILLPLMTFGLYIMLGVPGLPGKPYASRMKDPDFALASAVKNLQEKLNHSPSPTGYKRLAEVFYMTKNYAAATEAYQKAIDLGDNSAITWSEMGESVVLAHGGIVVPEALDDFHKVLKHDRKDARARFYIGLSEAQKNNFRKAVAIWKGVQKDTSLDATWFTIVKNFIDVYSKKGGFDPASIQPSQPSGRAPY